MWTSFSHDPRDPACAGLRASDADRGVVQQVLAEAYADGRLDREEFDSRTGDAAGARTLGELPPLVSDLVSPTPARRPGSGDLVHLTPEELRERAVSKYEKDRRDALWGAVGITAVCTVAWAVLGLGWFWPGLVVLYFVARLARSVVRRSDLIDDNVRSLEKKQQKRIHELEAPHDASGESDG